MSVTLHEILATNQGYRNDNISDPDADEFTLRDVLDYEINELENTDIYEYLSDNGDGLDGIDDVSDILIYVYSELGLPDESEVYGLWLTSVDAVIELYDGDTSNPETITSYELPDDYIILSDLGEDGVLIASSTPKEFWTTTNYKED